MSCDPQDTKLDDMLPLRERVKEGAVPCVEDHAFAPARLPDQGEAKPIEE
jgi:hypothetical protein